MEEHEKPTYLPPAQRRRIDGNNSAGWRAQAAALTARNQNTQNPHHGTASRRPQQPAHGFRANINGDNWRLCREPSVPRGNSHINVTNQNGRGNFYQAKKNLNFVAALQRLVDEDPFQVVKQLAERSDQWDELVKGELNLSDFQLVLCVLRKVCESEYDKHKAMLVNQTCHPDFMNCFPTMLLNSSMKDHLTFTQVAENIALFFTTLVEMLPITAAGLKKTVECCFVSLNGISSSQDCVQVAPELLQKYKSLVGHVEALQVNAPKKPTWHDRRMEQVEKMKYEQPPNDFREISIYPTFEDVVNPQRPFLRPNVINGPYFDVEHYLDTQYRLLREDFVRPLREGVQDILKGTDSKKCESLSVRVYKDVQFIKYVREIEGARVLNEGTLLCFDTSTNSRRFQRTNWEQTKKFMHGALLCFTRNCFQTLLFATVSSRDVKYLRQKQILVTFCEKYDENIYDKNAKYTMIESEVFFEPYYQVLGTLKNLNDRNFPFPKYFINVQKDDEPPAYLLDVEPVQIKIKGTRGSYQLTILNDASWPDAEQLGLDNSQYKALKAALTKELAVIQGPPGTGKTFMALKIAEILIRNQQAMKRKTPILVVCLTNHALDQFLVGMLNFTESLVRIGGQSRCEELDAYNLRKLNVKRSKAQYKVRDALREAYDRLVVIDRQIAPLNQAVNLRQGFFLTNPGDHSIPPVLDASIASALQLHDQDVPSDPFTGRIDKIFVTFKELEDKIRRWTFDNLEDIKEDEHLSPEEKQLFSYQIKEQGTYFSNVIEGLEIIAAEVDADLSQGEVLEKTWKRRSNMNMADLLELHYYILRKDLVELEEKRQLIMGEIIQMKKTLDELLSMENVSELRSKDVIGLTTNGAARLHSMLSILGCEIAIIEEAAEVMEAHIVACISKSCKHLILIGDHKQLRPKISEYELGKFYNFDVSLFERMVINREGCITLQVQHRMAPEMAKLIVPTIYKTLENHQSVFERPKLKSLTQRLSFVTHSEPEQQDKENSSRTNPHEASFLISLCQHLLKQGYTANQITILTTYKGQMFLIKQKLKSILSNSSKDEKELAGVRVSVVDDFQGEENDIILLSLVRSNAEGRIGFLATENRVCVALSRAKQGFIIIGDMGILSANNSTWKAVRKSIEDQNALDSSLTLRCEVHPHYKFKVSTPKDFQTLSPYGGCNLICEDQLNCGHPCKTVCHLMQIKHAEIQCNAPCERKCNAGLHRCKQKCFVKCGWNCMEMVQKNLPCSHQAMMRCHADEEHFFCTEIVKKKFTECNHEAEVACSCKRCPQPCDMQAPCGHSCTSKCHTDSDPDHLQYKCTKSCIKMNKDCRSNHPCNKKCWEECDVCEVKVKVKRSCGHQFDLKCHIDPEGIECRNMCAKMLDCGHRCLKKCNTECSPCIQLVEKVILECGHSAKVPCGREATKEDCAEQCKKLLSCGHTCKAKCSEECTPNCREVVELQIGMCGHEIKRLCLEKTKGIKADVMRCTAKCNTLLECGHACGGTCRTCHQGRFHVPCKQKCFKELICGHRCPSQCSEPCPPCTQKSSISCAHETQEFPCGMNKSICKKKCSVKCEHGKCTNQCEMKCNFTRCDEKCSKTLKCTHPCAGFCGSPCPGLCWECDKEELLHHAFPTLADIPEDPRFILLPDCHHTVEASALEAWFKWQSSQLEIKRCPLCLKQISAKLLRYKKEILEPFDDFKEIRNKTQPNGNLMAKELMSQTLRHGPLCEKFGIDSLTDFMTRMCLETRKGYEGDAQAGANQAGRGRKGRNRTSGPSFAFINQVPLMKKKMDVVQVLIELLESKLMFGYKALQINDKKSEVDFIVEMLKGCRSMSTQHTRDFERLLSALNLKINPTSRIREVKLPDDTLLRLKSLWQKCGECKNFEYGSKKVTKVCSKCQAALSDGPIQFPDLDHAKQHDNKGRVISAT
ncbi:NFX1-type zinc finger-containing protein 1-like [Neocloeon triangulifer]|uniref:NFX1-type zinc finger-containing protein 1-like n=1 Tax=Neocloeon triangulifer TaxID=2078957 RepID=UPI00286F67A3|nr:NFX1-type zinc finger-containing protein 1-like [Neocloeon triangulifer]XP_059472038.1 NFX1-type zinc finger-containing protein 1-like [Neocloeon triangulifer]